MHGVSKMVYGPKNHFWSNKYFINMMKHYDVHFILAFQLSDCYSSTLGNFDLKFGQLFAAVRRIGSMRIKKKNDGSKET